MDFGDDFVEEACAAATAECCEPAKPERKMEAKARRCNCELLQQRADRVFHEHKAGILRGLADAGGCDRSPKGSVDERCRPLMDVLNAHPDYVTTSSCSGRISVFHSGGTGAEAGGAKRGDGGLGWLFVSHEPLTDEQLVAVSRALSGLPGGAFALPNTGSVALKCEPFVMHVQCRTTEAAKQLMNAAATDAGFRNSGVSVGARIITAIRHAGLTVDVPLATEGPAVCSEETAMHFLRTCNDKLRSNFARVALLEEKVQQRLALTK